MSLPNDLVPDRDEARRRQTDEPLLGSAAAAAEVAGLACPDAETIGLYADGALGRADAAAVDAHIRGCARCEAIVAAIASVVPAPADAAEPAGGAVGGWLRGWRWLVPAASLAAAGIVAVWLGRAPAPETDMARADQRPSQAAAPTLDTSRQAAPERLERPAPLEQERRVLEPAPPSVPADAKSPGPIGARSSAESTAARAKRRDPAGVAAGTADAVAGRAAESVVGNVAQPTAPSAPAAVAASPLPAPAVGAAEFKEEDAAKTIAERATRGAVGAGGAARPAAQSAADARAPYPRWRVRDGALEFARDGRDWRRLTLPTSERLERVVERPDGSVVVTTASGVQWVSADLGTTWQRP